MGVVVEVVQELSPIQVLEIKLQAVQSGLIRALNEEFRSRCALGLDVMELRLEVQKLSTLCRAAGIHIEVIPYGEKGKEAEGKADAEEEGSSGAQARVQRPRLTRTAGGSPALPISGATR